MINKTQWIDYFLILTLSTLFLFYDSFYPERIAYILIGILFISPLYLIPNKWGLIITTLIISCLTFINPIFIYFIPATLRIVLNCRYSYYWVSGILLSILIIVTSQALMTKLILCSLNILAWYLSEKEKKESILQETLIRLKDESWEEQALLNEKNHELLGEQETTLALKIATERNRIARDIHDNVGHLLSSSIIQLGAIKTVNQEESLNNMLNQVDNSLNSAMTSIRQSVHDLHDISLPLNASIEKIVEEFHFCPITLDGIIPEDFDQETNNLILSIIKEALTNTIKHSNATHVQLIFDSLPAFYRIKIIDNGTQTHTSEILASGIGLSNIKQRTTAMNGQVHIKQSKQGFQLYIILPKE